MIMIHEREGEGDFAVVFQRETACSQGPKGQKD